MSLIQWDQIGERKFKTGVDHGVLYPQRSGIFPKGVAWNGLVQVTKNPSGAEDNKIYADNIPYLNIKSVETLGLTIECYTYPDEWAECNGEAELADGVFVGQQNRNTFGFSYRNKIGNDTDGQDYGYELNLIYNCSASPSEQSNQTINESPEAATFSYEINTTPIPISGKTPDGKEYRPSACITIDSTKTDKSKLSEIEEILYGKEGVYSKTNDDSFLDDKTYYELIDGQYVKTKDESISVKKDYYECITEPVDARLPLPDEVKEIFAAG